MRSRIAVLIVAALALWGGSTQAAQSGSRELGFSRLELKAGHSMVANLPTKVKRISVGSDKIADVLMINSRQLYLSAKVPGSTNVTLWDSKDHLIGVFEVRVSRDLTRLKEQLFKIMPQEPVEVHEMEGAVVLSGRVSSKIAKERAEAVAKAFAPKRVTSVLQVGGSRQVLLKVRFAEVSRKALRKLNINLGFFDSAGNFGFTFLKSLVTPIDTIIGLDSFSTGLDFGAEMTGMFGVDMGSGRILGFLEALKENGLAKILAEPTLVAASGQKAEFLAGGEYPIPVPQKDNITIEFKEFGVQLAFTPEIMDDGRIRLTVEPEVSELDFSTALVIQSFSIPGLTTRRAKTQLELKDGQEFAIAGLFKDDITQNIAGLPWLGDVPILGALFRSSEFQTNKTELIIVVSPELVKPGTGLPPKTLPGEGIKEPSDFDLFLMGKMVEVPGLRDSKENKTQKKAKISKQKTAAIPVSPHEMEGEFGHALVF